MLREVGCHLERGVHRQIEGQLVGDGGLHLAVVLAACHLLEIHFENARSEVHRTAVETGERKHCHVHWLGSSERLVLCTSR